MQFKCQLVEEKAALLHIDFEHAVNRDVKLMVGLMPKLSKLGNKPNA